MHETHVHIHKTKRDIDPHIQSRSQHVRAMQEVTSTPDLIQTQVHAESICSVHFTIIAATNEAAPTKTQHAERIDNKLFMQTAYFVIL